MEEANNIELDLALRQKVLDSFFQDGRLKLIPVKRKKRLIVLEEILTHFEYDKVYKEKEVNAIIMDLFDDYCTIRRELVDERMMERDHDGGGYWRKRLEETSPQ